MHLLLKLLLKKNGDTMNKQELVAFKENVDGWIKDINAKFQEIKDIPDAFGESLDNINHNYELIHEVRQSVEQLQNQIQTLKLTQLIMIKKLFKEDLANASKDKRFIEKLMKDKAFTEGIA